jgi:hypothetical protein
MLPMTFIEVTHSTLYDPPIKLTPIDPKSMAWEVTPVKSHDLMLSFSIFAPELYFHFVPDVHGRAVSDVFYKRLGP